MKEFWESRYSESSYAYGREPNTYFKDEILKLKPGKIFLPAEGEGRNAAFAASLGWDVTAVDQSIAGKEKALKLASEKNVIIKYEVADLTEYSPEKESFDAAALIFVHVPAPLRNAMHSKIIDSLKPDGILILEAFSKEQILFNTKNPDCGGPKAIDMLFSADELRSDFGKLKIEMLEVETVSLHEGLYHCGDCSVIRMIARKELM